MVNLDDREVLKKVDKSDMMGYTMSFPEQIRKAVEIGNQLTMPPEYKNFSKILTIGMGGSGIPGDMLNSFLSREITLPLVSNKNYLIPGFVDKDTLVFAISYSGGTEETIAAYKEAKKVGAKIIGVMSGSELQRICEEDGTPYMLAPAGKQTRDCFGYLFFSTLIVLQRMGIISDKTEEIEETIQIIKRISAQLGPEVPTSKNPAKLLAQKLYAKFPIIYGVSDHSEAIALRWKQQLNENSKMLVHYQAFPELNHNETVGWELQKSLGLNKNYHVIFLRDKEELLPEIRYRIEITKELIESKNVDVTELWSQGESILSRLFSLNYFGDFTSIYLAVLNNVDPTPVDIIPLFKKRLADMKRKSQL